VQLDRLATPRQRQPVTRSTLTERYGCEGQHLLISVIAESRSQGLSGVANRYPFWRRGGCMSTALFNYLVGAGED
jgi:hypothetical protein